MKRIAALLLLVFVTQVHAGLFSDDDARKQIVELRDAMQVQIKKLEERQTQQEAANKRTLNLLTQIEQLREEIAGLRGKLEVVQFNQDESIKRQTTLYVDLDARLRSVEAKLLDLDSRMRDKDAKEQSREQQLQQEQKAAQAAMEKKQLDDAVAQIKAGKNKDGVAALDKFRAEHPQSSQLAEAFYWTGAAHASLKDYKAAHKAFTEVVNKSPDHARAPDALLGLASIAAASKDPKASRKYLGVIMEKYPQSEAAQTAKKALAVRN